NERNWFVWIAHVLIEGGLVFRRRIERQHSMRVEIECAFFRAGRRPGRILSPDVRPCLEHRGFLESGVTLALQILLKEREDDVLAIIFRSFGVESDSPEALAFEAGPPSVGPGADHQCIKNSWIILLHRLISPEWPGQVFGIEPSAHH